MSSEDTGPQGVRQKLVESKEQWARDGRLLTGAPPTARPEGERLPPGQRLVKNWPVLDLGIQPEVPVETWRLTVGGLVDNPVDWSFEDFLAQPQVTFTSDIHCVTAWSRFDNTWEGVSVRHLLEVVRPAATATFVVCHSHDGYTTNLPLEAFAAPDALLAHRWEGKPIPREHGGPVRTVVPQLYFWKSAKWLKHIEFLDKDRPGFWELRGYHNDGDPWLEQRYS